MKKIIMSKVNAAFNDCYNKVNSLAKDASLADKYEAILPWNKTCSENFPPCYECFTEENENYKNWKDVEGFLPNITFTKCCNNEIEFSFDNKFVNLMVFALIVEVNGADITYCSDSAIEYGLGYSKESLEKAFEIRGLNYHQEDDYKIIISHK